MEKYIILYGGEELFYIMPNEDINLINNDEYKDRIEEIRFNGDKLRELYDSKDYSLEGIKKLSIKYSKLCKIVSD